MKKIYIVFVVVSSAILIAIITLIRTRTPFGKSNSDFASKPVTEITRIELSQNDQKLSIEKSGEDWLINGKTKARKSGINFIIRILTGAKIKSPVSPELFQEEISDKKISPVSVKVFEGRKLLKSFLVFKTTSNSYGNIMKIRERSKPFIIFVPGYEVNIGAAFTVNENFWQPYTIFNMLPSEINSVSFENLRDTSSSFTIAKRDGTYFLFGNGKELSGWNPELIVRYLSYFTFIPFESWALDMPEKEKMTTEKNEPLFRVTLLSSGGQTTLLSLWQLMKNENDSLTVDTDRLLGKSNSNNAFFIVRYFDIDPVIKKRSYFFTDNVPKAPPEVKDKQRKSK